MPTYILTESGDRIAAENGDLLITETDVADLPDVIIVGTRSLLATRVSASLVPARASRSLLATRTTENA